jgi:antitoxin (DNA-binding transcriptional repressor) of toxin-antitoxin stability system
MVTSSIDEAQSQLVQLIGLAERGEEIVIAREGKPVARLVAYREAVGPRQGGQWRGQVRMAPDFDQLPPQLAEVFGLTAR